MTIFKYTLLIVLFVLPVYAENNVLIFKNSLDKEIHLKTEIADTDQKRAKGLMYRKELDTNSGMLFIFPQEEILSFWMKNTYIPLSVAFIDRQGKILEIRHMKPLNDSIIYSSKSKALYALEVNLGWFNKNSIKVGCRILNIDGCIGK